VWWPQPLDLLQFLLHCGSLQNKEYTTHSSTVTVSTTILSVH